MSEPVFPRLVRFLQNLGWLPRQQTRKPIISKTPRKSLKPVDWKETEKYDFSGSEVFWHGAFPPQGVRNPLAPPPIRSKRSFTGDSLIGDVPPPAKTYPLHPDGPDFGPSSGPTYSASLLKGRPNVKYPPIKRKYSSYVENYVLREPREVLFGINRERPRTPTIRDKLTEEMKKEQYWFGC